MFADSSEYLLSSWFLKILYVWAPSQEWLILWALCCITPVLSKALVWGFSDWQVYEACDYSTQELYIGDEVMQAALEN